ncbi:hypothetical protein [Deinococcus knuensis]|nr:hypothetical protein [Deinococcus knuensis]
MVRLRTPEGHSLPGPMSTLRVQVPEQFGPDPAGGLTAHPELLRAALEALDVRLDGMMERAETDETLSVFGQETLIRSVLLGQALSAGLSAYAARPDRTLLERLNDLAFTLAVINPAEARLSARLEAVNAAAGCSWLRGVPLLPDEDHAMIALLLREAQPGGPGDPDSGAARVQERLAWAGYRAPARPVDPLTPLRAALTPPATLDPERHGLGQVLQRLMLTPHEGQRNAALLLLHVCGRDRLENVPLVLALDMALTLLRALHAGSPSPDTAQLLELHAQLHAELGSPDLPGARRERRQPGVAGADGQTLAARRTLRALRFTRLRASTPDEQEHLGSLWDALNELDQDLADGRTPEQDPDLRARLLLLSLQGLTSTARAPGMRLPPMVQLSAQISGVDPLWAWEATQPERFTFVPLHAHLSRVVVTLQLRALRGTPFWEARGAAVERLTGLAAGHLLASVRRAGLRLPEQGFLEPYLQRFGPLRALPLDRAALAAFHAALLDMLPAAQAQLEADAAAEVEADAAVQAEAPAPPGAELGADVGPAAGTAAPGQVPAAAALPAHVQAVQSALRGRRVVLLGGVPSVPHHAALVAAFGLRELDWIGSDEYAHGTHAHAHVTPDTAVVILAIRWMGHAHNALRDVARARGVPYVMHPGGLSPSSVAWQIGQQVSQQLGVRPD